MRLSIDRAYSIIDWLLPVYFVLAFIELYLGLWRLTTIVKIVSILVSIFISVKLYRTKPSSFKIFFSFFILFDISTVVAYAFNGRDITCYIEDLMNYIPAMLFFYVGFFEQRFNRKFYKIFTISCVLSMLVGLILYIATPSWYVVRQVEIANKDVVGLYTAEQTMRELRFTSYLVSEYAVIFFSMFALPISLFYYYYANERKSKIFYFFSILILMFTCLISMMRVAMVCSVLTLAFFIFRGFVKNKAYRSLIIITTFIILIGIIVAYIFVNFGDRADILLFSLTDRMNEMSLSKAMGGRVSQTNLLMAEFANVITGHGLGSAGPLALFAGKAGVTDAQYTKILFETGILGFAFFIYILIKSALRGLKFLRYYLIELVILAFIMVSMLGANTLCLSYLYITPFWYALGMLWNDNYLQYLQKNRIYV